MKYGKSVSDWNPGPGGAADQAQKAKLFSTEAHDVPENINGTNELKAFDGNKSGKPAGPFGPRGKEF